MPLLHQDIVDWLENKHVKISPKEELPATQIEDQNRPGVTTEQAPTYPMAMERTLDQTPLQKYKPDLSALDQPEPKSAWERLKDLLSNPPLKSQYEPSKLRKLGGAIVGGLTGAAYGPQVGMASAEAITDKPYREAYQDWATRTGALEKGAGLDISLLRAERSGLAGLGSLIRAEDAGDVKKQGQLAKARDEAKSPTIKKEFEYYKSQPGNQNATEDDYLALRKNVRQIISSQMVTAGSAQTRAEKGEIFKDISGNIIPINDLEPTEGLVLIGGNAKDQRYERVDQNLKEFTAGNIRTLFGAKSGPFAAPVTDKITGQIAQGPARVATTHEVPREDVSGNPVAEPLVNYPITTGYTSPKVNPPGPQQTTPLQQLREQTPQSSIQNQPRVGKTRPLGSFSPGEMREQNKYSVPSSAAMTQIIGDPKTGLEGLDSFADIADDKEAMERVGTAARAILNNMVDNFSSTGSIGADVGGTGFNLNLGSIIDYLSNISGFKKELTATQTKTMNDIVGSLNPREDRFLARLIAAAGDVVGFRSVIGGGAYQWSVNRLRAELPIPGFGVKAGEGGAKSFYARLASILASVSNGLKSASVSESKLPYTIKDLENKASEFNKLSVSGIKESNKNKYVIERVK